MKPYIAVVHYLVFGDMRQEKLKLSASTEEDALKEAKEKVKKWKWSFWIEFNHIEVLQPIGTITQEDFEK